MWVIALHVFFKQTSFFFFLPVLRLLHLWFNHGDVPNVRSALEDGFATITVDTWLSVIPQIIARIDTSQAMVRDLIHELFHKIGAAHPQALVYPLTVAR
jgi:FKBP12-rapamycin complex-associated protein